MGGYQHKIHLEYHIYIEGDSRDSNGATAKVNCLGKLATALSGLEGAFKSIENESTHVRMSLQNNELHFNIETDDDPNLYFNLYSIFTTNLPTRINQKKSKPESLTICEKVLNEFKKTMYDRNTGRSRKHVSNLSLDEIRNLNVIDSEYSDGDVREFIKK